MAVEAGRGEQPRAQQAAPLPARAPWGGRLLVGRELPRPVRRFLRHRPAVLAATVISGYFLVALLAPLIAPYNPLDTSAGPRLYPPNIQHWFGTDEFGRDIFSRVVYGARIAFTVGVSAAVLAAVVGSAIGLLGGYFGGMLDRAVTVLIDLVFAFPTILLAVALAVFLGSSMQTVIFAIGFVQSPHFARVVRGATLAMKQQLFVEAARSVGAGHARVLRWHIVPNVLTPLIVQFALSFSYAVLAESTLSFLGVGNPPPAPSWGAMLTGAYGYVEQAPWAALFPGLAITLLILGFNVMGDGLQDLLDPTRR
jgi:ABC-type dipeptide/oligopeptide/nickel transport system permease subunit